MMALRAEKIAIIGCGAMGEALIRGLLANGLVGNSQVVPSHPRTQRLETLRERYGVIGCQHNAEAVRESGLVVLAIKPQYFTEVAAEIRGEILEDALVLSIAAGLTIERLTRELETSRIFRAMPNLPAKIGLGITVWTAGAGIEETAREKIRVLLSALGEEAYVSHEGELDMATALSGTGPAYTFLFMEAMIDAGVHMGFSRRLASRLVIQTLRGAIEYAGQSSEHLAKLRNYVTSPGGTTAEAVYHLEKGRLRTVLSDAIWAAYRRSRELGET